MSPPNWDDDFDFDDIDEPKNKKKPAQKVKTNKYDDDDFFDDGPSKLPSIKNNNQPQKGNTSKRASSKYNPYAENMDLKGYEQEQLNEEILQQPSKKSIQDKSKQNNKPKQPESEQDFYQDIDDIPMNNNSVKQPQKIQKKVQSQKQEEDYGEEDFEQVYEEDDFEEEVEEEPKKQPQPIISKTEQPRKKQILNVAAANKKQPPKPPIKQKQEKQAPKRNLTSLKPQKQSLVRQNSQKSIKSVNSNRQRATSKSRPPLNNKFATNSSFIPNKYVNQITKTFPKQSSDKLASLSSIQISKMNDRVRAMIKRFNQELNNLINKNMLYLKSKKKDQKTVTVEDRMRVYEQQKKNNETMIEYMQREFDKLCGREGELRQEQYQLMTEKKIEEIKQSIKETQKVITRLKYQVKNQGNKLSKKGEDKKLAQQLHHLKTVLIQSKKDEEKHEEKISKLQQQATDLQGKIADIDYKISECVDKAKQKGIQLESKEDLVKKYQEIKKKVQMSRNHRTKLENLLKTKSDIISHEKQQLRINIKNSEMEIKNLYESINHSHSESVKVVEKAKTNPKVHQNLATHLDQILQSLEQAQQIDSFSVRSQSNKSQASQRPAKHNQPPTNPNKQQNSNKNSHKNDLQNPVQDQNKPNFMRRKPKVNDFPIEQKKNDEGRIWKDEDKNNQHFKQEKVVSEQKFAKKIDDEAQKKKPFSLKKRQGSAEYKVPTLQHEKENKAEEVGLKLGVPENNLRIQDKQQKKQEAPSLAGPRMMKFKRRGNNPDESSANTTKQINNQPQKTQQKPSLNINQNSLAQPQKKQQEQKPFVPKRFNLRNKMKEKKQESYIPSSQTKVQNKVEEPKKEQRPKSKQKNDYKFNFNEVEDPYSNNSKASKNEVKNVGMEENTRKQSQKKIAIPSLQKQEQEAKPRFNLRLRDRQKKNNDDDGGYMPSGASQKGIQIQPKINKNEQSNSNPYNPYAPSNNSKPKQEPVNNPYNPYAQQQNIDAPSRRKQGPIKKSKPQLNAPKQKINIYEQAEQAEGLNQFVVNQPTKKQNIYDEPNYGLNEPKKQEKEPDLNELLGLNNNKKSNNDDLADLLGGGGGPKKNNKKKNDFFGDMDF